jgi:hypothetical protein
MEFEEFIKKQEEVYNRFRNTAWTGNDVAKPNIKVSGGYFIMWRHDDSISERIEEMSQKMNKLVPSNKSMIYPKEKVHTTSADYILEENFHPDNNVLSALSEAVYNSKKDISIPAITYNEWVFNLDTFIAIGYPNGVFVHDVFKILENCEKQGLNGKDDKYNKYNKIKMRTPWGSHITAGRFTDKVRIPNKLFELIKEKPLGISMPKTIDVGHFYIDYENMEQKVYDRINVI